MKLGDRSGLYGFGDFTMHNIVVDMNIARVNMENNTLLFNGWNFCPCIFVCIDILNAVNRVITLFKFGLLLLIYSDFNVAMITYTSANM
jgi:hypothetical protein